MSVYRESHADEEEHEGGFWNRLLGRRDRHDDEEEEVQEDRGNASRRNTFRIASAREGSISVMPVGTFADIQKAADRLKSGEPQIINLERTPPEVSERLIDFLNGVTYALDGYVEKISEGAYLFTPSHIAIHAETSEPKTPFFDR